MKSLVHRLWTRRVSGPQVLENSGGEEKKEGVSDSFWSRGYQVEIETISANHWKYWTFQAQKNRLEGRSEIEEKLAELEWRTEMGFPNQILQALLQRNME
ncbi:MAG: hypothetical protein HQL91_10085 [Magnetococcales bacterium]|nr:hypothetical protein [Magnetococcales bacterium]